MKALPPPGSSSYGPDRAYSNVAVMTILITLAPPMFVGTRAFDGPACTP
jgi:hypothetical protein